MLRNLRFPFGVVAILILANIGRLTAQSDRVDSCVAAQMSIRHIPGLALAVIKDGAPVKVKGYGLANVELNVPVSVNTVFQSASIGKQFTAALIMLLVEQGKINLDSPITTYFQTPRPHGRRSLCGISSLTLRDHRPRRRLAGGQLPAGLYGRSNAGEDQADSPGVQPGEKWAYSNSGTSSLGFSSTRLAVNSTEI